MTFNYRTSRVAKLIVDSGLSSFEAAQDFLQKQTLEVIVGKDATSPAAHAAILTGVATASRAFLGGVRVIGATGQPVNSRLPLQAETIREAAQLLGAHDFDGNPAMRICIGEPSAQLDEASYTWWDRWRAGSQPDFVRSAWSDNPLVGISAGAAAVSSAFEAARKTARPHEVTIDLWPVVDGVQPPDFGQAFLPDGLWLCGLGNLGQAFLWSLTALPYAADSLPKIYLQDFDRVSEENWGTSILVNEDSLKQLKTRIAEDWALRRGFTVHRVDRRLTRDCHRLDSEPSIALCGFDNVDARLFLGGAGFPVIIDAGLGRTAKNFDEFRVTIFDRDYLPETYFGAQSEGNIAANVEKGVAYRALEDELGDCGAAEIAGASVAVPHVSAIAGAVAVARALAICSARPVFRAESRKLSRPTPKRATPLTIHSRELLNGGNPVETK